MKSILLFTIVTMMFFTSCSKDEFTAPYINNSYGTQDSIHLDVIYEVGGIDITIARTEEGTYGVPSDGDCEQIISTSHWFYTNTIRRNFTPTYVRFSHGEETYEILNY